MICEKCGFEIAEGKIYCSRCGHETRIVPDYNLIDDYLTLNVSILDEDGVSDSSDDADFIQIKNETVKEDDKNIIKKENGKQESLTNKKYSKKTNTKKIYIFSAIGVFLLVCIAAIFIFVGKMNESDYGYQIKKAREAIKAKDYQWAITYLNGAITLDNESVEAKLLLGEVYLELDDNKSAIETLNDVFEIENDNKSAIIMLADMYKKDKDYAGIAEVLSKTNEESVLDKYADYVADIPSANYDSGEYDKPITVELVSDYDNDIFYTLDNSDPRIKGEKYTGGIKIKSGENILKICSVNDYNVYSDVKELKITVLLYTPEIPTISPASGTYSEKKKIDITCEDDNCKIYYTWDGTVPNASSQLYTGDLEMIPGNNVLSVVAINEAGMCSRVAKANYICSFEE